MKRMSRPDKAATRKDSGQSLNRPATSHGTARWLPYGRLGTVGNCHGSVYFLRLAVFSLHMEVQTKLGPCFSCEHVNTRSTTVCTFSTFTNHLVRHAIASMVYKRILHTTRRHLSSHGAEYHSALVYTRQCAIMNSRCYHQALLNSLASSLLTYAGALWRNARLPSFEASNLPSNRHLVGVALLAGSNLVTFAACLPSSLRWLLRRRLRLVLRKVASCMKPGAASD